MRKEKKEGTRCRGREKQRKKGTKPRDLELHGQTHTQYYGLICQQDQELVKPVLPLQLKFSITTEKKKKH